MIKGQTPTISVIVPVFNSEKYLEKCVFSILNQTYRQLEVIIVNDGSEDDSWNLCKKLSTLDNRLKVYTKDNEGVSIARNFGFSRSKGSWIMFVDADDYLKPTLIEELIGKVNNNVDIVASSCNIVKNNGEQRVHFFNRDYNLSTIKDKKILFRQLMYPEYGQHVKFAHTAIGVPWGKIYRKNFLTNHNLKFDEKLTIMEDNIFNMYAFYYARTIKYIDKPLYCYRYEHMDSCFTNYKADLSSYFLPVIENRYMFLKETGLYSDRLLQNDFINETIRIATIIFKSQIFNKNNPELWPQVRKNYFSIVNDSYLSKVLKARNILLLRNYKEKIILSLILVKQVNILCFVCKHF